MASVNSPRLRNVAIEIRLQIFSYMVSLESGAECPALLPALTSEKDLFKEAREVSKATNYVPTDQSQERFMYMKMGAFMKIRHLTMVWEGNDFASGSEWLDLKSFKGYLFNNFETITVDLRGEHIFNKKSKALADHELEYMVRASLPGVNRIVFVLDRTRPFRKRNDATRKQMRSRGFGYAARVDGQLYRPEKWIIFYERLDGRRFLG
ncbi:uncharacterized protein PAC_08691 [Phialocephala subalpina]|uniref:Uncharacterized protein n=1 Tax=Phialocephala subalpina TaxID=576137 RepID=A0A1L7X1A2_9HELO|nr:uncharacterized protein PAC_08691 [Phialocephala subalpina]